MSIFIFRRDFRIKDNTAWNNMLKNSNNNIYPIFIFTPEQIKNNKYKSNNSVQFMIESLLELSNEIKITFCYGDIENVLIDIIKNNKINSIYTNTDYTPYSVKREKLIENIAKKYDLKFIYSHDITLYTPGSIKNSSGLFYQKFTPFYRSCVKEKVNIPEFKHINKSNIKYANTKYEIDEHKMKSFYINNDLIHVHGGRINALHILKHISDFNKYNKTRNILNIETTNLSAYLKFGCISIREAYHKFLHLRNKTLIRQLIWREFYYHLGYGFIHRFGKSLKPNYDNIKWINNNSHYKKWCEGKTGYPIIDACMTQLNKTGYMHNRGRLLVSSFLIKNLMIDWRYGEKYFAQKLVDYDVLVNQGNWQWTSGSGADSQPYFRVFSPILQSKKYDKDCLYIKKWLPQLKEVDCKHLHDWEKYHTNYENIYYKPLINYSESKNKALTLYRKYLK
jgi:deoxyribodipyrimidine photo-lyase